MHATTPKRIQLSAVKWFTLISGLLVATTTYTGCQNTPQTGLDASSEDAQPSDAGNNDRGTSTDAVASDATIPPNDGPSPGTDAKIGDGSGDPCIAVVNVFNQAVQTAKKCDPAATTPQCTVLGDDEVACPCPTYMNKDIKAARDDIRTKFWIANGCDKKVVCTAQVCQTPKSATCDPKTKNCTDTF